MAYYKINGQLVKPLDYGTLLSNSEIPYHTGVVKFGYNNEINSGVSETVWSQGGLWLPIAAAETVNISSTSVLDDPSGTGMSELYIFGLDASGADLVEVVTLSGTDNVLTTGSFSAINRMAGSAFGTGLTNAGIISAIQSSSAVKMAEIPITTTYNSITQQCVYTIPLGYTGYLKGVFANISKGGAGGAPEVQLDLYSYNQSSGGIYKVLDLDLDEGTQNVFQIDQPFANPTAERNTLFLNATTDKNGTKVFARLYLELVKNVYSD